MISTKMGTTTMIFFVLMPFGITCARITEINETCRSSGDCNSTYPCCRDINGQAIVYNEGAHDTIVGGSQDIGTCTNQLGKNQDLCDDYCQCEEGLTCYRPMSGACCPPRKCYDAKWVQEEEEYWKKCLINPDCFLPP